MPTCIAVPRSATPGSEGNEVAAQEAEGLEAAANEKVKNLEHRANHSIRMLMILRPDNGAAKGSGG